VNQPTDEPAPGAESHATDALDAAAARGQADVPDTSPALDAADALERAVRACCAGLTQVVDRDWSARADDLSWSVSQTVEHTASCLVGYAGQVVGQPATGWVVPEVPLEKDMTQPDVVRWLAGSGAILASVVRTTPAQARGFHPYGTSDPVGFACMGIVEALVHTYDVMHTFDVAWTIPPDPAQLAVARLFRDAPAGDPVEVLLWCAGRQPLRDLPRREKWRWDGTLLP